METENLIFTLSGIRGIIGKGLNANIAKRIAIAFGLWLNNKDKKMGKSKKSSKKKMTKVDKVKQILTRVWSFTKEKRIIFYTYHVSIIICLIYIVQQLSTLNKQIFGVGWNVAVVNSRIFQLYYLLVAIINSLQSGGNTTI